MKTVVVIGGGITGLSALYYLHKQIKADNKNVRCILIEASDSLGGKIDTVHEGPFIMEAGADSIVTRKTNVAPLLEELGLQDEVVYNATGKSFIYADGELKPIPDDTVFGIPLSVESLAKSNLVSAEGKVEALKDFYTVNETFTKNDSIGAFLESFLGKELVEKQISPVLSGVYSGQLNELTIASTLPYLLDYKNEYGSIIQGLSANKKKFQSSGGKKFMSFKNGVSCLVDTMEERLTDAEIRKGVKAEKIEKAQDGVYRITLANSDVIEADYIVLSTLHTGAQALLQSKELDEDFSGLKNSSLISVYLGFDIPDHLLPKDGTGFITADNDHLICNACTWTSRKWDHTSANRQLLVRLFYKSSGASYETLQKMSENELLEVGLKDIEKSLGITGKPVTFNVTKWHETMPNYHIKHPEIVKSLETKMDALFPHVLLAGCSYYGVGIPDCIANGEAAALKIAEWL
ncbi:protoporphyrinogen oxidase [Paenibacillus sp. H1-7]|uniref:protoporphyrinogen oxidase n=1 Tax=Paenibacillus sp. H1-7 TaxID=2282849 RepID=UPI001EF8EE7E|nr:protoporphyrinogen oxidase [Paenibacillus sp. H1-7]ULL18104.1 protoporphyrinogen oxidase [Paenibacillus sp. H1-7]